MKITYWSDFACPYCYIGNTRLKKAIDELGIQDEVEFDIHAFELDQNAPKDVESTTVERFALKYNLSIDDAQKQVDNISKLGIEDGIDFRYASTLYTNTRDAHRLMKLAQSKNEPKLAEILSNLLFDAYFSQNLKLADREVLLNVSKEAGLDPKEAEDVLNTNLYNAKVERDEEIALSGGIHAVPFYLFDGKYSVPGALSFKDFKSVLSQILEENAVDNDKDVDSCEDGVCRL
ncbi:MAG: DsbA family oxidoreductase [Methanobrevibacter sp.]|uniref:DsbA family oxidoreductase n=1 Tax=Methanobrevibacter sp. TaxID=66852 RepID=UPI0025E268B4|nr:DsbA family oxidoreductase [Methanobrevibacter sp.]MBR0271274.1 DsbA family oxidoreductase [Methanobrevibacter sp.]